MHFSSPSAITFSDITDLKMLGIDGEAQILIDTKYRYFPREMNLRTEESGDFGEQFEQMKGFVSQLKQTRVEPDTPESGYFTHIVMLSALPYVSMPAASSYTMHAKYPLSGSAKF